MNKKLLLLGLLVFIVAAIVNLTACWVNIGIASGISKSLLMPSLALVGLQYISQKSIRLRYALAMLFYTIGDIVILSDFMLGMIGFFAGHIFLLSIMCLPAKPLSNWKQLFALALALGLAFVLTAYSFGLSGLMKWLVMCYAAELIWALVLAVLLRSKLLALGVLLFIVSDSLIAVHSFAGLNFVGRPFAVMSSYIFAQMLLTQGIARLRP